ncbi:MAG: peptide-methionine (S)-S-oxide reductase MsrA [Gemmatimonadales bacterium]
MRRSIIRTAGLLAIGVVAVLVVGSRRNGSSGSSESNSARVPAPTALQRMATFAGGCFWSMQKAFDGVAGIVTTTAGYAGGTTANPKYEEVETGATGHAESVQVVYDPAKISYAQLLDIYWHHIDPLTVNAAFCDHGPQYRSIIFYADTAQRRAAEASKKALDDSHRFPTPIVTAIEPTTPFYAAEEYHQLFYKKNPAHYEAYRIGCGRDARTKQLWGDIAMNKESK